MEDISPSPVESGFLTGPSSTQATPNGTCESLDSRNEPAHDTWKCPREPRSRSESLTLCDPEERKVPNKRDIHYPSSPDISQSYRLRNEQNDAETSREASKEQELSLIDSEGTADKGRKRSLWRRPVMMPLWLLVVVVSCVTVFSIVPAVLLGWLIPRDVERGLSSCGPPCEESWIWVRGRCYYFSDDSRTWNKSLWFCHAHNSTLAVLMDPEIKKSIERYKERVNYWIGLCKDDDNQWTWTNGSLYESSVKNDDSHLRCAYLNSHLGALDCSTGRRWICVKDST